MHCPECGHELGFIDQIPLLSVVLLGGRYSYCKHAIPWQFPFIELSTAFMFVVFAHKWEQGWYLAGMLTLGCTLIAATITDIKAQLIPHDITYPSMVCGVLFSYLIRQDILGALAGIGISYLIFDLLAHYGLKAYLLLWSEKLSKEMLESDFQVVGGADAVLAAVIGAWLGWQKLLIALAVSFVIGICIGIVSGLHKAYVHGGFVKGLCIGMLGAVIGFVALSVPLLLMNAVVADITGLAWIVGGCGAILGFVYGITTSVPRESHHFAFAPALAVGGFVAMLY